ncbi:hypothetical protein [Wenzhou bivalvia virus 1]|uniref:hypothetical protein n=1 Tax=Wenzhou bivalvia virus 1 TaxID=1923553 RepID=UPI00090A7B99|nr:hypothetical protein [Wenzhou bivalvia virus 1]APG76680.1 hypothetical protein [Wenzhou bivalvia virus 1]
MSKSFIKQSKSQDSFTTKFISPSFADIQQRYSDYMERRIPNKALPLTKGKMQASELLTEVGGAAVENLVKAVGDTIIGGDNNRKNNDRPGLRQVEPVIQFASFGLLTGVGNTGIDRGIQTLTNSRAMRTQIAHHDFSHLLKRTYMINTFSVKTTDDRGASLYTFPVNIRPITTSHVPNMTSAQLPISALAGFFSYYKMECTLTFTPVATVFDRATLIICMAYGTDTTPTLEQASNQMSQTLEIDGSGRSVSLKVNFVTHYPVLRVPQGEGSDDWATENIGLVSVLVVNKLTSNSGVVNPEVPIIVSFTLDDYELTTTSQCTNTELMSYPITLKNPPLLGRQPRPSFDDNYIPRTAGRLQSATSADSGSGISDGNKLTGTGRSSEVVNSASIGGTKVPSYGDMMRRSNIADVSLQIDQFTTVGVLQVCSFWDLVSRQAKTALRDFMYLSFDKGARMDINVVVQGSPSIKGALALAFYPMTTPSEAELFATSLMNISAPEGTVVLQFNGTNTIDIQVPLSTALGGLMRIDSVNDAANCPFTAVFYMITPYLGTPDTNPVTINIRTKLEGVSLSTPKFVANLESSDTVGLVRGKFQSGVIDEHDDSYTLEQKPASSAPVPSTLATSPPEDNEKAMLCSWRCVVSKQAPEVSTGGQKGILMPLHIGYSDITSGAEISAATSYPVAKNISITPGERDMTPQPSGFDADQCVYMTPFPGISLLQCYRFLQADIDIAVWINTVSGKSSYLVEVIYDPRVLFGAKYPLPNIDEGQFRQGSISQGYMVCNPNSWTMGNIPFASNYGTALTPTDYDTKYDGIRCPMVIRISSRLRKGVNGGTVTAVPDGMGFGPGTNKVLDFDLTELQIFIRFGENTTYSIPMRVPQIWSNPEQPEGKYSDSVPTETIPTVLDVICGVAGAPNWVQQQDKIVKYAELGLYRTTTKGESYSPSSAASYFTSREQQHIYVFTTALDYSELNALFGTSYSADTVFIGNGMMTQIETSSKFLQMSAFIGVEVLAQNPSAGALNQGLTRQCFLTAGYEFISPGTQSSHTSEITLNANAYAIPTWRSAGYIPASYNGWYVVPDWRDPKAPLVQVDSGVPYQIPNSTLMMADVYDLGNGNRKGLLMGSPFLQVEEDVQVISVDDAKGNLESAAGIDIVRGQLQCDSGRERSRSPTQGTVSQSTMPALQDWSGDESSDEDGDGGDDDKPPIRVHSPAAFAHSPTDEGTGLLSRIKSGALKAGMAAGQFAFGASRYDSESDEDQGTGSLVEQKEAPSIEEESKACFVSSSSKDSPPAKPKFEQEFISNEKERTARTDNLCNRIIDMAISWKYKASEMAESSVSKFKKFWAAPSKVIKAMFGEFVGLLNSASSTVAETVMGAVMDPITSFKDFFVKFLKEVPIFVIVILVIFVVSELCNTDIMKTRILPWLLTPLARLIGAVCGALPVQDLDVYNGWFWDSFRAVKDKFSRSYNYCVKLLKGDRYTEESELNDYLNAAEVVPEEEQEEEPEVSFGTKLSHWVAVLVDSFSLHTLQKYLGRAAISAGSAVSLMVWLEKRFTSANKMLEYFGKIAPAWYTYIANKFVSKHSEALNPIHGNLEFVEQAIYAGAGSSFLKDQKSLLTKHIAEITRFSNRQGYLLSPVDREFLKKILVQATRLESVLPKDMSGSHLRAAPVMLIISGEPGIGKSCLLNWLLAQFAKNPDDIARINLTRDSRIETNMYNGQSVAEISELLSMNSPEARELQLQFLLRYCENAPNVVDSAFTKGEVRFEPYFSGSTTNYNWTVPLTELTDPSAFFRRVLILKFRVKDSHRGANGRVIIDKVNFSHLEAAPVVDKKICGPRSKVGVDKEFGWPGATTNSPVRVGREIGEEFVRLSNGVLCKTRMDVGDVVTLVNDCAHANMKNLNALLAVIRGAKVQVDTFSRDLDKIFSDDIVNRTAIHKAIVRACAVQYQLLDDQAEKPTVGALLKFMLGESGDSKCFLAADGQSIDQQKNYGTITSKFATSSLVNEKSKDYDLLLPLFGELDKHEMGYCMQKLRIIGKSELMATQVDYSPTNYTYEQVIEKLVNQEDQSFIRHYMLADLLKEGHNPYDFKVVLREESPDFFIVQRRNSQGNWVNVKKTHSFWDAFKNRMCSFCSLMSLGRDVVPLPKGALVPEKDGEVNFRARPIFNPFSHGFWCTDRTKCDCRNKKSKDSIGFGRTIAGLAAATKDHPYLAMAVGAMACRTAMNVLDICNTVKLTMKTMLQHEVKVEPGLEPNRRPFLGTQFRGDVPGRTTRLSKIEFIFMFDSDIYSIEKVHEFIWHYMKAGGHTSIHTCAIDIVKMTADFYEIDPDELDASFAIFSVEAQEYVKAGIINILGEAVRVDRLRAYVRGVIRMYEEDQQGLRVFLDSIEEEVGELQSKSGKNRKRAVARRKFDQKSKQQVNKTATVPGKLNSRFELVDGLCQSYSEEVWARYGISKVHEIQRLEMMGPRVWKIRVKPKGTNTFQTAYGFDLGMRQMAIPLHMTAAEGAIVTNSVEYNPIADTFDLITIDAQNRNTMGTIAMSQVTNVRAINDRVNVDVGVINMGNGSGTRKALGLFMRKPALLEQLTFANVLLLVGGSDPISIGQVLIKPQQTTAMEKTEGSSLKYVHSGVLLYPSKNIDMTGLCGCPYVAKYQGNWFIIGFHSGIQYDLQKYGLEEGEYQVGVLVCQEMLEATMPVQEPKVSKKSNLPDFFELGGLNDEVKLHSLNKAVEDRAFTSEGSETEAFKESYRRRNLEPVTQYAGRCNVSNLVKQKTGMVESPVAHLTGHAHLYGIAFQGDSEVSTREMQCLGLDRTTYKPENGGIPGEGYIQVNGFLRSIIVQNPPSGPLKPHCSLLEVLNGGSATGLPVGFDDIMSSRVIGDGDMPFGGIDTSASAGVPGKGHKQRDFLTQIEIDGQLYKALDSSTTEGRVAIAVMERVLEKLRTGETVAMIFKVVLKDEALNMAQVKDWLKDVFPGEELMGKGGKTRIITCLFFAYNLILKIFLLPVVTYLKFLGSKIGWVTGKNPYSPDYQQIFEACFDSRFADAPLERFLSADVSDQESCIDTATISGLIDLIDIIYSVQANVWIHKRGNAWMQYAQLIQQNPKLYDGVARNAVLSSTLPSYNLIGNEVFYVPMRNQSGAFTTTLTSTYYTIVSEGYALLKGYDLALELVEQSKYASKHDLHALACKIPMRLRELRASGDDQITCYTAELLALLADANRVLTDMPAFRRKNYPVPTELHPESSDQKHAGSFVQSCTLFYCGLTIVDPDTGGPCKFTSHENTTFLANYMTTNPELSLILAKKGVRVDLFARLQDKSKQKCLNYLRLSEGDDPMGPLCQNFNTVLELTFTAGPREFELLRSDLIDMLQYLNVEFPLVTFDTCLERYLSRDYVLGDEDNVFDIH